MILSHEWETIAEIRARVAVDPGKLITLLSAEFYARNLEACFGEVDGEKRVWYRRTK